MNKLTPFPARKSLEVVSFNRKELAVILSIYGKMVAAGEWRGEIMVFQRFMMLLFFQFFAEQQKIHFTE